MKKRVILSTIPSDAHGWNLIFMDMFLSERGFTVENLGICTPVSELLRAIGSIRPCLVVVSTVNGHGYLEAGPLAQSIQKRFPSKPFELIIGGKLGVDGRVNGFRAPLLAAGYDAVFDESQLAQFETRLKRFEDLEWRQRLLGAG